MEKSQQQTGDHQPEKNISIHYLQLFSGPLPSPELLEKYEKIGSGFAERLFQMAEKEQDSRIKMQEDFIKNDHIQHMREIITFRIGQFAAFLSVVLVIALCAFALSTGFKEEAVMIAKFALVTLPATFLFYNIFKSRKTSPRNFAF